MKPVNQFTVRVARVDVVLTAAKVRSRARLAPGAPCLGSGLPQPIWIDEGDSPSGAEEVSASRHGVHAHRGRTVGKPGTALKHLYDIAMTSVVGEVRMVGTPATALKRRSPDCPRSCGIRFER